MQILNGKTQPMSSSSPPLLIARSRESQLDPDDQRRLAAAEGYVELGLPQEAAAELAQIGAAKRSLPVVLSVRLDIYLLTQRWTLAAGLAKRFAKEIEPENARGWISWAYATRRAESVRAAQAILLAAKPLHRREATIHFNLACYAAQLGDVPGARSHLGRAIALDEKMRALARFEPDLQPIW